MEHRKHGFLGMMVKPYDLADVSRALREALKGRAR